MNARLLQSFNEDTLGDVDFSNAHPDLYSYGYPSASGYEAQSAIVDDGDTGVLPEAESLPLDDAEGNIESSDEDAEGEDDDGEYEAVFSYRQMQTQAGQCLGVLSTRARQNSDQDEDDEDEENAKGDWDENNDDQDQEEDEQKVDGKHGNNCDKFKDAYYRPHTRTTRSGRAVKVHQPMPAKQGNRGEKDVVVRKQSQRNLRNTTDASGQQPGACAEKEPPARAKRQRLSNTEEGPEVSPADEQTQTQQYTNGKQCLWEDCPSIKRTHRERLCHMVTHFPKYRWKCAGAGCKKLYACRDNLRKHCGLSTSCIKTGDWKRDPIGNIQWKLHTTGEAPWTKKEVLEHLRLPPEGDKGGLVNDIAYWRKELKAKPWPLSQH